MPSGFSSYVSLLFRRCGPHPQKVRLQVRAAATASGRPQKVRLQISMQWLWLSVAVLLEEYVVLLEEYVVLLEEYVVLLEVFGGVGGFYKSPPTMFAVRPFYSSAFCRFYL